MKRYFTLALLAAASLLAINSSFATITPLNNPVVTVVNLTKDHLQLNGNPYGTCGQVEISKGQVKYFSPGMILGCTAQPEKAEVSYIKDSHATVDCSDFLDYTVNNRIVVLPGSGPHELRCIFYHNK